MTKFDFNIKVKRKMQLSENVHGFKIGSGVSSVEECENQLVKVNKSNFTIPSN